MQNHVLIFTELWVRTFGWLPTATVLLLRGNITYSLKSKMKGI